MTLPSRLYPYSKKEIELFDLLDQCYQYSGSILWINILYRYYGSVFWISILDWYYWTRILDQYSGSILWISIMDQYYGSVFWISTMDQHYGSGTPTGTHGYGVTGSPYWRFLYSK